jgi:hypothetical protein
VAGTLAEIVTRHTSDQQHYRRVYGSISRVIGAANSMAAHDDTHGP